MTTTRGRLVHNNQVILDQADYYEMDGTTRVVGLTASNLVSQVFFNNLLQPWPLVSGVNVPDAQVVSGRIYFNEISGSPGFYSVRFRPNAVGFWRNILTYVAGQQSLGQDFDVVSDSGAPIGDARPGGGLNASFIKPDGKDCC